LSKTVIQNDLLVQIEKAVKKLSLPESPALLYEPVSYCLRNGGKRIRPYLLLLANGMCGGKTDDAMPAALAVELLHNFTLVHDDIMDQAEVRRGEPSIHAKWDESTAILSGDAMFAKSFELLNFYGENERYSKKEYFRMIQAFQQAVITVCEGQAMDLELASSKDATLDDYLQMIKGKTAALLSAALAMGGIAARSNDSKTEKLHELGNIIGIAFQIQDDLLDAVADPDKFGKTRGGDIFEGKKTYLSLLTLKNAKGTQKKELEEIFSKKNITEQDVELVLNIYHELGIISKTEKVVESYYNRTLELVDDFGDSFFKHELKNLLSFLKEREH